MATIDEKIQKIQAQLKAAQEKKQAMEARKRARALNATRKNDTRRKILSGAVVLQVAESDPSAKTRLWSHLDKSLVKDADRALFDLPPLGAITKIQVGD